MMMRILTMKMMMTSKDSIIRINSSHLQDIRLIENEAFKEHSYDYEELLEMINKKDSETYIYYSEEEPAGYISFYIKKGICRIESIGVRGKFQRMGIGKKLMILAEGRCKSLNGKKIILETFEKNLTAIQFYQNLGYEVIGFVNNYYSIPYDGSYNAIRMKKILLP